MKPWLFFVAWALFLILPDSALDSPEIRALASRYGQPNAVLSQDWVRHSPGINAPGDYPQYAKNPWKYQGQIAKKKSE